MKPEIYDKIQDDKLQDDKLTEQCPELYYRPFHRYEGERQLCKINHKSCVRQGGCSCYIFDEYLIKLKEA